MEEGLFHGFVSGVLQDQSPHLDDFSRLIFDGIKTLDPMANFGFGGQFSAYRDVAKRISGRQNVKKRRFDVASNTADDLMNGLADVRFSGHTIHCRESFVDGAEAKLAVADGDTEKGSAEQRRKG